MISLIVKCKKEIICLLAISALYFLLRLPNLTLQPIFADEAIYIRWAQVMKAEPTLRFLPLSDGKTPFFMWTMIPLFKIFSDPLFAGRSLSVLAGFFTVTGVFFLGWRIFNLRVGLWAAFLAVIAPMLVFFDRMALVDSMLAAFSIWSLNVSLLLLRYQKIDLAMVLGYLLGGGLLTKTPAMVNLLILPVTLFAVDWGNAKRQFNLLKVAGLWLIALIIALVIYNMLRLGPGFDSISSRNQDYLFSVWELRDRPLDPFIPHLWDLADWLPELLTLPILLLTFLGVLWVLIKRQGNSWAILLWSLLPLTFELAFFRTFTARYILFTIPPLFVLAANVLAEIEARVRRRWIIPLLLAILLPLSLIFNINLLQDPASAPLPREERRGYLEDWTAGYGLKDIAEFLNKESHKASVVVGTEGSFGTLPDGLQIYLDKNRRVTVIGGTATVSSSLREAAKDHSTYFVANKSRFPQALEGMEIVREYPKTESPDRPQDAILLFRILR